MMRVLWVAQQRLQNRGRVRTYLLIGIAALLTTVIGAVGTSWLKDRKSAMPVTATKNTIAVLPLQNMTGDNNLEYLRFALTDEIASVLTYSRVLDVRPTRSTRKCVAADVGSFALPVDRKLESALPITLLHYDKQGGLGT